MGIIPIGLLRGFPEGYILPGFKVGKLLRDRRVS